MKKEPEAKGTDSIAHGSVKALISNNVLSIMLCSWLTERAIC